ncbi:SAM-dependent methyltransferase [Crossiella sp. CA-258035]|uniref:SAM-dependent methyltransferase n=1 Tax=Crossiella sp. CA-258035 TaxID=2981138 RepID=UPI0024BD22DC|nr:SAM-dependent methyltransferase [Crossiella sp. CA-258035]WHT20717.1 SAM-dependent methyltransferase [Crossiella sp. CA-258035]
MTENPRSGWVPQGVDVERPSAARIYDYYLGGGYNFESDRQFARKAIALLPSLPMIAQQNRVFLRRAVRFCVQHGIRQFLDIGSGIPSVGNVHEVAQQINPEARVVYVDNEPVAVAHSRMMLSGDPRTAVVQADVRDPDSILGAPETRALIDFDEPVGLLMVALLHFVPPADEPKAFLAQYRDALAPGSYLALSHATLEHQPAITEQVRQLYENSQNPMTSRTKAELEVLFDGFDLIAPGIVFTSAWRPESPEEVGDDPERSVIYAAVGRRR